MAEDWGYQSNLEVMDALLLVRGAFIVDAGCGEGELCRQLASRGASVLGIEPDPRQAKKNEQASTVANVGFAQAGAGDIPVESNSVDGVIFSYSLHHVPASHYEQVFDEVYRILKSHGFLYVIEPIANGSYQHVMEPFHDETKVRYSAYQALEKYAHPNFGSMREIYYDIDTTYESFDRYVEYYESRGYNSYSADVRQAEVEKRFKACVNSQGSYTLTQPLRLNYYSQPKR